MGPLLALHNAPQTVAGSLLCVSPTPACELQPPLPHGPALRDLAPWRGCPAEAIEAPERCAALWLLRAGVWATVFPPALSRISTPEPKRQDSGTRETLPAPTSKTALRWGIEKGTGILYTVSRNLLCQCPPRHMNAWPHPHGARVSPWSHVPRASAAPALAVTQ